MSLGKHVGKVPRKHGAPGRPSPETPGIERPRVPGNHGATAGALGQQLGRWLPTWERSRVTEPVIHASALWDLCTKQRALVERGEYDHEHAEELVPAARRVRFDIGKATHDLVRDKYLGPMGVLYGDWRHACGATATGTMPTTCTPAPTWVCEHRDAPWTYVEREVDKWFPHRNPEHEGVCVIGHIDGMEMSDKLGAGILEVKSVESVVFNKPAVLAKRMRQHVFTVKAYLWLTGFRWARLLYVSTGMEPKSAFKDFVIKYDLRVAARIERTLREVIAGGQRSCRTSADARAIVCPARKQCWGLP